METPPVEGGHKSEMNILLLGGTGVGKSTFINALFNYLSYSSLDDALEKVKGGQMQSLIYSKFLIDDQGVEKMIAVGVEDDSQSYEKMGISCTRRCNAYNFSFGENSEMLIRLIDTPGMGDTRGCDQDKKNMSNMISYISRYEVLHAICILLKPNEERLTQSLKYCIITLLAKLHKDASSNILFCFTNSRTTMYKMGSTRQPLRRVLADSPQTSSISLATDNMFMFDSEAFRFLASVHNEVKFNELESESYRISWKMSTASALRLIEHIRSLTPHKVKSTLAVYCVRVTLAAVREPLFKISADIEKNLVSLRSTMKQIRDSRSVVKDQKKFLYITKSVQRLVDLVNPRTICNTEKCKKNHICHEDCKPKETIPGFVVELGAPIVNAVAELPGVAVLVEIAAPLMGPVASAIVKEMIHQENQNALTDYPNADQDMRAEGEPEKWLFCSQLSLLTGKCLKCGCNNSSHTRVSKDMATFEETVENEDVRKVIDQEKSEIEKKNDLVELNARQSETLKEEQKVVIAAAAVFAGYMAQNSIITYHKATEAYLMEQIKQKEDCGDEEDRIKELNKMLQDYREEVKLFQTTNTSAGLAAKTVTIEDVEDQLEKLYALSENGKTLKELLSNVQMESTKHIPREEVSCNISQATTTESASGDASTNVNLSKKLWEFMTGRTHQQ